MVVLGELLLKGWSSCLPKFQTFESHSHQKCLPLFYKKLVSLTYWKALTQWQSDFLLQFKLKWRHCHNFVQSFFAPLHAAKTCDVTSVEMQPVSLKGLTRVWSHDLRTSVQYRPAVFNIQQSELRSYYSRKQHVSHTEHWNKQIIITSLPHGTKCFMYQNKNMNNPFRVKPEAITRFACCGVDRLTTFLSSAHWSVLYILQLWGLWTIIIICSNNNNSVLHNTWKTDNKQSPMLIIVIIIKSNSHWLKTEVFRHARMVECGVNSVPRL